MEVDIASNGVLLVVSFDSMCQQGASKCFGFVDFAAHESAIKAVDEMNGKEIGDKQLYCTAEKKVWRPKMDQSFTKLFVKNLQPDVDQEKLRAMFQQFGKTMSAVVIKDREVWNSILKHVESGVFDGYRCV